MDQANKIHQQKVVVIRLPSNFPGRTNCLPASGVAGSINNQGDGPQLADINQIPDEVIAEMVSNQYKHQQEHPIDDPKGAAIDPNMMIDNSDEKQVDMYGLDHPELAPPQPNPTSSTSAPSHGSGHATYSRSKHSNHNDTTTTTNNGTIKAAMNSASFGGQQQIQQQQQQQHLQQVVMQQPLQTPGLSEGPSQTDGVKAPGGEEDDKVLYRNYSPKQREWMLVVLSYSRGLMAKPFEMKLQETVVEKARDVLRANAETFGLTNRLPTHKTLRGIWANLWKHPDRTVGVVKKGGRPRIDPAIKRRNRNEREKRRRAAKREVKSSMDTSSDYANGAGGYYHQMDHQSSTSGGSGGGMARRSQRGH